MSCDIFITPQSRGHTSKRNAFCLFAAGCFFQENSDRYLLDRKNYKKRDVVTPNGPANVAQLRQDIEKNMGEIFRFYQLGHVDVIDYALVFVSKIYIITVF